MPSAFVVVSARQLLNMAGPRPQAPLSTPPRFQASFAASQASGAPSSRRRKPEAQLAAPAPPWGLSFAAAGGLPTLGARLLAAPGPAGLALVLIASRGYEGAVRRAGPPWLPAPRACRHRSASAGASRMLR